MHKTYAADLSSIRAAAARIAAGVHRTPTMTSSMLDARASRDLFLKCENLQRTGSFKMRGALNTVLSMPEWVAQRGVVTHSSGNFAQALALAARSRGIPAHIVMPSDAPQVKREAVIGYGARVITSAPGVAAREATAEAVRRETGATLLHPYDNADVIAGQGTVGLELLEQAPDLDAVIVPVGGGGLVAGIALAVHEIAPRCKVFAAEPAGADDAYRSVAADKIIPQTDPRTLADGLRTSLGELTFPVIRDLVEEVLLVGEAEIVDAMRLLWTRCKQVTEPSGAVALAAVLNDPFFSRRGMHRVGVIVSGGNVELDRLPWCD